VGSAVEGGASIVRVHDVAEAADYLRVREAIHAEAGLPAAARLGDELRHEPERDRAA
jgi:hypothetical protein